MTNAIEMPQFGDSARPLAGRSALVTGGGSSGSLPGVGVAVAVVLALHGASVGVLDKSAERSNNSVELIESSGGTSIPIVADITDPDDCERAVAEMINRFGRLDVLVNNAAIVGVGPADESYEQTWNQIIALDLTATMTMSRRVVPHMRTGGGGAIVNVSSIAAVRGMGGGAYSAAKAGVIGLTYDFAYLYGRDGIRVNCVMPGNLFTPMGDQGGSAGREARTSSSLLGTEGTAWDAAMAILFLSSDESRWITGVVLPVDGGAIRSTHLAVENLDRVRSLLL